MAEGDSNTGIIIILVVVVAVVIGLFYMSSPTTPQSVVNIPKELPPIPTTPTAASPSSTDSTPASIPTQPPEPKARTIGEWKDQTFPHNGTRGKTNQKISDSECKTRCINEPECVAASYSQWGDCVTWTNLGSDGPTSDCCSGTALIDSDHPFKRTFTEGASYRCNNGPAGENGVYRAENNILRHYPTADIAASWNPNWENYTQIDCAGLNFGSPMTQKT